MDSDGDFFTTLQKSCGCSKIPGPWQFDEETADIYRNYVKLRYQLIPYLYDLYSKTQSTGLPMMRPLILEYPQDEVARQLNDEFMFGSSILVAPVVEQGQTVKMVYLRNLHKSRKYNSELYGAKLYR